jgi:hypothetical protein
VEISRVLEPFKSGRHGGAILLPPKPQKQKRACLTPKKIGCPTLAASLFFAARVGRHEPQLAKPVRNLFTR